jgi:hypothetical protein
MTNAEGYNYDEKTLNITDPGKFEGEARYMPHFYDLFLNGCADEDDGETLTFNVEQDDIDEFPELADFKRVRFFEDSQGFVREI